MKNYCKIEVGQKARALGKILLFIIAAIPSYTQSLDHYFHRLSSEEGLSQASNDFIYHDSKGFIWLSSIDGLNRFDGKNVKVYKSSTGDSTSLLGNIITSNFFEDNEANLWFTTYEGIHCYVRKTDRFKQYQIISAEGVKQTQDYHAFHLDSTGLFWVRIGLEKDGRLYNFDTGNGSYKYLCELKGRHNFPVCDEYGIIQQVVSCNFNKEEGIKITDVNPPNTVQSIFDGSKTEFPTAKVYHINIIDKYLWSLGTNKGLILYRSETNTFSVFDNFQNNKIGKVFCTATIGDSILWVSSSSPGVYAFDIDKNAFIDYISSGSIEKSGLQIKKANKIYTDDRSNVWISSFSSGVNYTNLQKRKFEVPEHFHGQSITAIYESSQGDLFCSYSNGKEALYPSYATQNLSLEPILLYERKNAKAVLFYFEKDDHLWAVTVDQLFRWNEATFEFDYVKGLPDYVLYVYQLKDERILLSSYSGIFEIGIDRKKVNITPFEPLDDYQKELATSIYETNDNKLILAVDASSLLILEPQEDAYHLKSRIDGVGYAKSYYEDQQFLWIATSNGIMTVNKVDDRSTLLTLSDHGIPNEYYYSIIPDENENFWLSSNRGIINYQPREKRHWRYSLIDGIQGYEFNTNSFLKTSKGELWMGGTNGLNRFFPNKIMRLQNPPQAQITKLLINDELYNTNTQIGEIQELDLTYEKNTLSFEFVSLEYSDPENNQLKYILENHEDDWVDAQKNGFARYSNLPAGTYTFKVKASNSDGVWNEVAAAIDITIQKPWWQTWWFYAACLLSIFSIIYLVVWYRLQQALKMERMRVKISSDLHDDVGSILAGLTMQTEILAITANEDRQPKLNRVSEMSRNAMSRMRDTVWAIDARKDKLKDLIDRVRDHAMEALELKNIKFDVKAIDLSTDKKLTTQIRQNLYLICKEAITNAAKHSNADAMEITFAQFGRKGLQLIIKDDGEIDASKIKTSGLGLSNIEMRAEEIGAGLEIKTSDGFYIELILQ